MEGHVHKNMYISRALFTAPHSMPHPWRLTNRLSPVRGGGCRTFRDRPVEIAATRSPETRLGVPASRQAGIFFHDQNSISNHAEFTQVAFFDLLSIGDM